MSHNDHSSDSPGSGAGGSSSAGGKDLPEYGQRVEGAPGGPSYEPPRYGQGSAGDQYASPQYGQGQYGSPQHGQGQYGQGGYPGPYQGQYDMGQYGAAAKPAGTGLGIAALVLGIVALLTSWMFGLGLVPGLVGLVLGIVAVRKLGRVPGASKAMPVVGIVLSVLGILASIVLLVVFTTFMGDVIEPCSQYVNDQAALEQCINEQLGMDAVQQ